MKLTHGLSLIIATACLPLTGCSKAVDEKTAIANFKTDLENISQSFNEKLKSVASDTFIGDPAPSIGDPAPSIGDPVRFSASIAEIFSNFKAVKTDGLPADLKSAWSDARAAMGEMSDLFKKFADLKSQNTDDVMKSVFSGEIWPKFQVFKAKARPAMMQFVEVGKKYGLDRSKIALP